MCLSFGQVIQNFPKLRAVVHFAGVGQLVQEDVIHQVRWKEHQVARQVDAARSRTTSPTALATRNLYFLISEAIMFCQFVQERGQVGLCTFLQGTDDGVME